MKTKEKAKKGRIQVGIDKELKENAEQILEELGLNATTEITILYKQVVSRGEFPIEIKIEWRRKTSNQVAPINTKYACSIAWYRWKAKWVAKWIRMK